MPRPQILAVALLALAASLRASSSTGQEPPQAADPVLGEAAALLPETRTADLVWVEPGTPIRPRPDATAPPITLVDARLETPVLDRRDGWLQVRYGGVKGWIADAGGDPLSPAAAKVAADARRLAAAIDLLGGEVEPLELGSFELYTDVEDEALLTYLGAVAERLPAAYRRRYGIDADGGGEAVILFAGEELYREYAAVATTAAIDLEAPGHAGCGLAALFVGGQAPDEAAAVLIHELAHLLNRRALSPVLPPWLEEGIANDLAFSRIDSAGDLVAGSLDGRSAVVEEPSYRPGGWLGIDRAVDLSGPAAILRRLAVARRAGDTPPLGLFTDLLAGEFFHPAGRQQRYDLGAFFVRYLLDGDLAVRFRSFLAELAAGGSPASRTLRDRLDRDWDQLERGFTAWLDEEEAKLGS